MMYYVAFEILKDTHSAEDAVHQVFLRVINHLEKINIFLSQNPPLIRYSLYNEKERRICNEKK